MLCVVDLVWCAIKDLTLQSKQKKNNNNVVQINNRKYLNILGLLQQSWREFFEKKNKAATVIQTAWRSSLKRPKVRGEHDEEEEEACDTRPGRSR